MTDREWPTYAQVADFCEQARRAQQVVLVNAADRARVAALLVQVRLDGVVRLRTAEVPVDSIILTTVGALEFEVPHAPA